MLHFLSAGLGSQVIKDVESDAMRGEDFIVRQGFYRHQAPALIRQHRHAVGSDRL